MMFRAFVPATTKDDLEAFPAWFVSFDGQQFVETTQRPIADRAWSLKALWQLAIDGPKRMKRGQSRNSVMPQPIFQRAELEPVAQIEEVDC